MRKENEHLYIGHPSQVQRMEEHILKGGKGDGLRLLEVNNGDGLEFTVSLDRCADLSRLSYKGVNMGYFAPCGYVAPTYYDSVGFGFLKSFTAGLMTTCGFINTGAPCDDDGEKLPQHGTIGNVPADSVNYWTDDEGQHIYAEIREARFFGQNYLLKRRIDCPNGKNCVEITDTVVNIGGVTAPLMYLYHCNIGYPILSEDAKMYIPSKTVAPCDDHAAEDIDTWDELYPPQAGYQEQCYFHTVHDKDDWSFAAIFNEVENLGIAVEFNAKELGYLTEWRMLGTREYVVGLEPGNGFPLSRVRQREVGNLKMIEPGEEMTFHLRFNVIENEEQAKAYKTK